MTNNLLISADEFEAKWIPWDDGWFYGGNSLWETLNQPGQFAYYQNSPVDKHLYNLAKDVLIRWDMERCGITNIGRTLPSNYYYFTGDGKHNYFRAEYSSNNYWDWSLPSPH